jgi:dihydroorotate dehydrogenase electron transfer subunit
METKNLKVLDIKELSAKHYLLEMENSFTKQVLPGQFIHLKIEPFFLRRPFSIAGSDSERIKILFRVVGEGSNVLSEVKKGTILNAVGPLGTPFPYKKEWKHAFIVAGGTGAAPLFFLAQTLVKKGVETIFFYGARNIENIMFKALPSGIDFVFSTEDGSYGEEGFIHKSVLKHIKEGSLPDVLYSGGPYGLLKEVSTISTLYKIPAFVSLENRMACGTGLCGGCVTKIKTKKGWEYKKVCKDGPVFSAEEVVWEGE